MGDKDRKKRCPKCGAPDHGATACTHYWPGEDIGLRAALEQMVDQYAEHFKDENGEEYLYPGTMSALEDAFATLGWPVPYYPPKEESE